MNAPAADFVATSVFMLLGTAVSCNARLARQAGAAVPASAVAAGWGAAFACGLFAAGRAGAHMNPAVTLGLWACDRMSGTDAARHVAAQCAGTALGMVVALVAFVPQWTRSAPEDRAEVLMVRPAVRAPLSNLLASVVATGAFVFVMLRILAGEPLGPGGDSGADAGMPLATQPPYVLGHLAESAVIAGIVLFACVVGAGAVGAPLNPARAVVGRVVHAVVPAGDRQPGTWADAWIAVAGPALGALLAAWAWRACVA
ncbi:MAG: aquaporin [Planctomycetota bacterium]